MNKYMTDEELLQYISDIEECNLVEAPPHIVDKVLDKVDKRAQLIEYRRFRNKVIASVAAILVIASFAPEGVKLFSEKAYIHFEMPNTHLLSNIGNSYYISDFLNEREE